MDIGMHVTLQIGVLIFFWYVPRGGIAGAYGSYVCMYLFIYLLCRATPTAYGGSQARGSNQSCSCRPTPQPQQCWVQAVSVIYTTAHDNTGSLTYWVRSGIEPESSWILRRVLNLLSHNKNFPFLTFHSVFKPLESGLHLYHATEVTC